MNLDDAKSLWTHHQPDDPMIAHTHSDDDLLRRVKEQANAFNTKIWRRDLMESIAALIGVFFFAPMLDDPSWLVRIGAGGLLVSSGLILWRLHRNRRRHQTPAADRPVAEVLRAERAKVDTQIRLLTSILWWYIAPIATGLLLIAVGDYGILSAYTAVFALFLGGGAYGIYRLNQRAVRNELRPRRKKLTELLDQVTETDASTS